MVVRHRWPYNNSYIQFSLIANYLSLQDAHFTEIYIFYCYCRKLFAVEVKVIFRFQVERSKLLYSSVGICAHSSSNIWLHLRDFSALSGSYISSIHVCEVLYKSSKVLQLMLEYIESVSSTSALTEQFLLVGRVCVEQKRKDLYRVYSRSQEAVKATVGRCMI